MKKPLKPIEQAVDQLADWQQYLDKWEVEMEEARRQKTAVKSIASLLGTLCEMLRCLTRTVASLLDADRASIFLLDRSRKALISMLAEDGDGGSLVIDIPSEGSIAGLAATSQQVINIPFDVYDAPYSLEAKNTDRKTGYRSYTLLACPLLDEQQNVIAVVQFINKLKLHHNLEDDLSTRIDIAGFTSEDEALFARFAPAIFQVIKKWQYCYQLTQEIRKNVPK